MLLHSVFLFVQAPKRLFVRPGRDVGVRPYIASKPKQRCRRGKGEIVRRLNTTTRPSSTVETILFFFISFKAHRCACFLHTHLPGLPLPGLARWGGCFSKQQSLSLLLSPGPKILFQAELFPKPFSSSSSMPTAESLIYLYTEDSE